MKYLITSLLFLITTNLSAQVDTTIYYPLHIGDKWAYYSPYSGQHNVEIIGDTLMPNEKTYFIFSNGVYAWRFQRSNNDTIYYYNTADSEEYALFSFTTPDKTLWKAPFESNWWGLFETTIDDLNLISLPLTNKIFDRALIDTIENKPDTTWGYIIDLYPTQVTKGFGITSYNYGLDVLIGAKIDTNRFGTLVSINDQPFLIKSFVLNQNYPNPFNPITKIEYNIPVKSKIKIDVFNALGKRIKTLYTGFQKRGKHIIEFNGTGFTSGVYFTKLQSGNHVQIIKMLLIK
ncbi:MAG: T9SS type A sorting domain-containing protein [Calditrichaeota bacterium]|nr:T9SS type A sorting domain-containing protein [Calditrichota bacterium]